jgi:hypothetical protein
VHQGHSELELFQRNGFGGSVVVGAWQSSQRILRKASAMSIEDQIAQLEIQIEQLFIHYRMLDRWSAEARGTRRLLRTKITRLKHCKQRLREFVRLTHYSAYDELPHAVATEIVDTQLH